jgi:hypothetical protein
MPDTNTTPFSYTVLAGDYSSPLFYVEQDGVIAMSITGLKLVGGKWIDEGIATGSPTTFQITGYGENGTSLNVTLTSYMGMDPSIVADTVNLAINFNSKLDLTLPLPVNQVALADSFYTYNNNFMPGMSGYIYTNITGITQNS